MSGVGRCQQLPRLSALSLDAPGARELAVRFRVRVSLSSDKRTVLIGQAGEKGSGDQGVRPYEFYCGAWMGGSNPHMEYQRLESRADGTGEASMTLRLLEGDFDTFKVGVYVRDRKARSMRHVVSGYNTMGWLRDGLDGVDGFDAAKQSLPLRDNYTPNSALLHFCNESTDLSALRGFLATLKPSSLHKNDFINKRVVALSFGLHDCIEQMSNVLNMNGGPSFINSACFTEAAGCATNYPLLDLTYSSDRHRVPLAMLAYSGLATLHYVGMSADALLRLSDADFVGRFIVPLCTSFTVCARTSQYSGDETLSPEGRLDLGTEDFAMVMSKHFYTDIKAAYKDVLGAAVLREMDMHDLARRISELRGRSDAGDARAYPLISDDCETLSGLIKSYEGAIHQFHLESAAFCSGRGQASSDPSVLAEERSAALAKMMWEDTRDLENLASVPMHDFVSLARLLDRYGRLRENHAQGRTPSAQMGLCIVSAKGPSFSFDNRELNGHACVIAQCLGADGSQFHTVAEGTSNLTMRDLPVGCPAQVTLNLTEGPKKFDTGEAFEILAGNMADHLKTFGKTRVGECIPSSFGGKDPYVSCPFYMAGFFIGLRKDRFTPGFVPMEMRPVQRSDGPHLIPVLRESGVTMVPSSGDVSALSPVDAGVDSRLESAPQPANPTHYPSATDPNQNAPVFGAPVVGLSGPQVSMLPVDLGDVFGKEEASEFLQSFVGRNSETYPPRAGREELVRLMSRWAEIGPLDSRAAVRCDPEHSWICSSSEAFDDADALRAVLEYKTRIARKFNALQAEDPKSDGGTMVVSGHMLSVVCHLHIPLPKEGVWNLSCARNIQQAVKAFPLLELPAAGGAKVGSVLGRRFSRVGV